MAWRIPLILLLAWLLLVWIGRRATFHPIRYPSGFYQEAARLGVEDVWLRSGSYRLHGWWKPLQDAPAAVLILPGNTGNVSYRSRHVRAWTEAGAASLVLDYRGYGRSEGWPTESGLYEDAMAGYRFLRGRGFEPRRILLHGESLGTAAAAFVASVEQVGGVILEAPFPSARAVAQRTIPFLGPLAVWGFGTEERAARFRSPLLVIHGDADEVIPFRLGRRVFDAAPEPKEFWAIRGAGHNDIPETAGAAYPARLRAFLEQVLEGRNIAPAR